MNGPETHNCDWCGGYWECDGEGGGCSGLRQDPHCDPSETFGEIGGENDPLIIDGYSIAVLATVTFEQTGDGRWDFVPNVTVGGEEITENRGGSHPHYGRSWQLHDVVNVDGTNSQGETKTFRLRVQAYAYPQKCVNHPEDFQIWPKLRIEQLGT